VPLVDESSGCLTLQCREQNLRLTTAVLNRMSLHKNREQSICSNLFSLLLSQRGPTSSAFTGLGSSVLDLQFIECIENICLNIGRRETFVLICTL
jgi:hypothetical protein